MATHCVFGMRWPSESARGNRVMAGGGNERVFRNASVPATAMSAPDTAMAAGRRARRHSGWREASRGVGT